MSRSKLDDLEQQIEDEAHRYVPVVGEERSRIEHVLEKSRKTRSMRDHQDAPSPRQGDRVSVSAGSGRLLLECAAPCRWRRPARSRSG